MGILGSRSTLLLFFLLMLIGVLSFFAELLHRINTAPGIIIFSAPFIILAIGGSVKTLRQSVSSLTIINNRIFLVALTLLVVILIASILVSPFTIEERTLAMVLGFLTVLMLAIPPVRWITGAVLLTILGGLLAQSGAIVQMEAGTSFIVGASLALLLIILVVSVSSTRRSDELVEERLDFYQPLMLEIEEAHEPEKQVSFTEVLDQLLEERRFGTRARNLLMRANLQLTVAELAAFQVITALGFFSLIYFILLPPAIPANNDSGFHLTDRNSLISLIAGTIGLFIPNLWVRYRAGRRLIQFYNQLPHTIVYLRSAVGQGFNSVQAMERLAHDASQPTAEEFRRVVAEQKMGIETTVTLDHLLERIPLRDLTMTLRSMQIQSRQGGNIVRLLGVAHDMVMARTKLFFEVGQYKRWKARMPFIIFSGVLLVQWVLLSDYWNNLLKSVQGQTVLAITYSFFVLTLLVIGYSRRHLRSVQRRIGFAAIADLEVFFELIAGSMLLVGLGMVGVPLLLILLAELLLIQVVTGLSLEGILLSIAISIALALNEPTFFPRLAYWLVERVKELSISNFLDPYKAEVSIFESKTQLEIMTINSTTLSSDFFVSSSSLYIFILIVLIVFMLIGALIYLGMHEDQGRDPLQERLLQLGDRNLPESLTEVEVMLSFRERVLLPLIARVARRLSEFTPQVQIQNTLILLDRAGLNISPVIFSMARLAYLVAGFLIGIYVGQLFDLKYTPQALAIIGAILGYLLPSRLLHFTIARRHAQIGEELPEVLTLLDMYLSAGISLDNSMQGIYDELDGIVALGFGRVLREITLGKLRRDALADMATRINHPDLSAMITTLMINDTLGDRDLPRVVHEMREDVQSRWVNRVTSDIMFHGEIIDSVWQIGLVLSLVIWILAPFIGQIR